MVKPFILFADCKIYYDGRANSVLERGNYIIIYKQDGSLSIHGNTLICPRNYQGAGSKLSINDNCIISTHGKETIKIEINKIIWKQIINDWSAHEIKITKTEAELVQKIIKNPMKYFGYEDVKIQTEYPTPAGPIDIVAIRLKIAWVVEVKRKKISFNNCIQLRKYLDHIELAGFEIVPCMAGPEISSKALKYCQEHNYRWIEVGFDNYK